MHATTDLPATTASDTQPESPAVTPQDDALALSRRMIAVSDLAAHPGNVREDLNLAGEFLASIAAEGVRIPLLITTTPEGQWRVIEGHRRLAAAVKTGLAEVPCDIDPGRAGDEAGQYLDMLLANSGSYRANYTIVEETAALFAAHEAGASRTRIRKATGRTAAEVKTALAAGKLPAETRAKAAGLNDEVTLEDLAVLAEFDGDADATDRLLTCLEHRYPLDHTAEQIRQDRAEAAEHQRIRADLAASGITVTDHLPEGAAWLASLRHDGEDLTPEAHAACPGHGATFRRWNLLEPSWYCASPAEHGHTSRWALPDTGSGASGDAPVPGPGPDPGRRLVITGNKAWQAAAQVRHRWLAGSFFPRKSVPREAHVFLARQLLAMPDPLRGGLATAAAKPLFAELTGHDLRRWDEDCGTAAAGRLAVAMLGPVITAYEHAMTDGEGRSTWRTDRYSPCPRAEAGRYLAFLASIGYQLSAIEQAVADGVAYSGEQPAGDSLPGVDLGDLAVSGQPVGSAADHGDSSEDGTRAADAAA